MAESAILIARFIELSWHIQLLVSMYAGPHPSNVSTREVWFNNNVWIFYSAADQSQIYNPVSRGTSRYTAQSISHHHKYKHNWRKQPTIHGRVRSWVDKKMAVEGTLSLVKSSVDEEKKLRENVRTCNQPSTLYFPFLQLSCRKILMILIGDLHQRFHVSPHETH